MTHAPHVGFALSNDSLNDERGTGGQSKLARLLDWDYLTLHRKFTGKSPITKSDALAIQKALGSRSL